jgi:hypothetical protein
VRSSTGSKTAPAPLFFIENGSSYKMFGRAPLEKLELEPVRNPTKQDLNIIIRHTPLFFYHRLFPTYLR